MARSTDSNWARRKVAAAWQQHAKTEKTRAKKPMNSTWGPTSGPWVKNQSMSSTKSSWGGKTCTSWGAETAQALWDNGDEDEDSVYVSNVSQDISEGYEMDVWNDPSPKKKAIDPGEIERVRKLMDIMGPRYRQYAKTRASRARKDNSGNLGRTRGMNDLELWQQMEGNAPRMWLDSREEERKDRSR